MPKIKPQDQTPLDTVTIKVRRDIRLKMEAYAKMLQNSTLDYVLTEFFLRFGSADPDLSRYCKENPEMLDKGGTSDNEKAKKGRKLKAAAAA